MDPDLDLLDRWCAGDRTAGSALFSRYFDEIYRFFETKVDGDTEDLVQHTFQACVLRREEFRRPSTFRTFLFAIARVELYGYWRARVGDDRMLDFTEVSLADIATTPASRLARDREHERLLAMLRALPLESQVLLELHYWEGMGADALAEVFEIAPATANTRLFRARQVLRERLEAEPAAAGSGAAGEAGRDADRDAGRDADRDAGRDPDRDADRDAGRDAGFDGWVASLRASRSRPPDC